MHASRAARQHRELFRQPARAEAEGRSPRGRELQSRRGSNSCRPWCRVPACSQGDHSPLAAKFHACIRKQHNDLQAYLGGWIEHQDRLVEDFLQTAFLTQCPAASAGDVQPGKVVETPCMPVEAIPAVTAQHSRRSLSSSAHGLAGESSRWQQFQGAAELHESGDLCVDDSTTPKPELPQQAYGAVATHRFNATDSRDSPDMGERNKSVQHNNAGMATSPCKRGSVVSDCARELYLQQKSSSTLGGDGRMRSCLELTVKSPIFEKVVGTLIVLSALGVGIEVEISANTLTQAVPSWLQAVQTVFCVVFLAELLLRWASSGVKQFVCHDEWRWNCFDIGVVLLSVVDLVVASVFRSSTAFLQVTRVVRIVRIVRLIRVVRYLRELRIMIYSICHTIKSLVWSLVLMLSIMYLFAVYITQATVDHILALETDTGYTKDLVVHWGSIPMTAYTLFKCMTGGVSWGEPVNGLMHLHWGVLASFFVFISFTLLAFLNIITGFFCVSASDLAAVDKEQIIMEQIKDKRKYMTEFCSIFKLLDHDNSGDVSIHELEDNFQDPKLQAYFSHLNLEIAQASEIFKLLDCDGSGTLSVEEFVVGCLQLRGPAKALDIACLDWSLRRLNDGLSSLTSYVEAALQEVDLTRGSHRSGMPLSKEAFRSHGATLGLKSQL